MHLTRQRGTRADQKEVMTLVLVVLLIAAQKHTEMKGLALRTDWKACPARWLAFQLE